MDSAKMIVATHKKVLERKLEAIDLLLTAEPVIHEELEIQFDIVEKVWEQFQIAANGYFECLVTDEATYGLFFEEFQEIKDRMLRMCFKVRKIIKPADGDGDDTASGTFSTASQQQNRIQHRLQKLELPKFSGDCREWLVFWNQFKNIHDDGSFPISQKFQYLLQCMVSGSKAKEVADSYIFNDKNYPLLVADLKERFGREEMLVEIYIRELLGLVLENGSNKKSSTQLSTLYVKLTAHIRALETLGVTTDKSAATFLYPMVESALPDDVMISWERWRVQQDQTQKTSKDHLDDLIKFLKNEVAGSERVQLTRTGFTTPQKTTSNSRNMKKTSEQIPTSHGLLSTNSGDKSFKKPACIFCDKEHGSDNCGKAGNLSLDTKNKIIKDKKACMKCLKPGHFANKCRTFVKCLVCGGVHLTVMCSTLPHHQRETTPIKTTDSTSAETSSTLSNQIESPDVLLQTLVVYVEGKGRKVKARAIIDSGSQKSYVVESLAKQLELQETGSGTVLHQLFGGVTREKTHKQYKLFLGNTLNNYQCNFDVSDSPTICGSINTIPEGPWRSELAVKNIKLTDTDENCKQIQILIGADVAGKLYTGKKLELPSGPVAVETLLGWTLMGKIATRSTSATSNLMVISLHVQDVEIKKLWELDAIGIMDPTETKSRKEIEEAATNHFKTTVAMTGDGRCEVHLPWVEGHAKLPSNRFIAERRLESTTNTLLKDKTLHKYDELLKLWEKMGIVEEVPGNEIDDPDCHYIPHRAVYKPNSETTPIRPVFDASCKTKGNPSLNDCMEMGPNTLEQIPAITTRFRVSNYGVLADIEKAFLNISVRIKDRNYMRFLWWKDVDGKELKVMRHCRVMFGVKSSPWLLSAVLTHLLDNCEEKFKKSADILKTSLYVDNLVASVESRSDAEKFKENCECLLLPAHFVLRDWEIGPNETEEERRVPLLGLLWGIASDTLTIDVTSALKNIDAPITKRHVLSMAHRIFDPIGFTAPFTLLPKLILQEICEKKLGWDENLPDDISSKFKEWSDQLPILKTINIPRWFQTSSSESGTWELIVFVDASKYAYGAGIFLRACHDDGTVKINLVQGKTRVAPRTSITIPRMELLSCTMGARLAQTVREYLNLPNLKTRYFTDSSTAFYWILNNKNWGVFVHNRVMEIRKLTKVEDWSHVSGEINPADLPSRGCDAEQLRLSEWWMGPKWLYENPENWPKSSVQYHQEEIEKELKRTVVSSLVTEDTAWTLVEKCDNYPDMLFRAFNQPGVTKSFEDMDAADIRAAEMFIVRKLQEKHFVGEKDDKLRRLPVIKDEEGYLRIKTRLGNGNFEEDFVCPLLLPHNSDVIEALIVYEHENLSHAGATTMQACLREKFWILKSRRTIRNAIRKCSTCSRFNAKKFDCEVAPLPKDRIQATIPFQVTGVDLFGPLYLRGGNKCWVALFTCAVYRAVHLEVVTSLSTESFKNALRRFVARRGKPQIIYSDNGTNFVGCNNQFREIKMKEIQKHGHYSSIEWRCNPPTASWWGGFFERMVGIVKKTLRRVLGASVLNKEDLITVLCDVEAVINSRPLTYTSEDPNDVCPLTPNLFLCGTSKVKVEDADVYDAKSLNKRLNSVQVVRESLRSRFRKEYLGQLRNVVAGKCGRQPKVGELVMVGHDNLKRIDWPVGRITSMIPGRDGKIRLLKIKTDEGEFARPLQRIYPLEVECDRKAAVVDIGEEKASKNDGLSGVVTRSGRKVSIPVRFTYINI